MALACPTLCDKDCEASCHEVHQVYQKRDHNPDTCPSVVGGVS